MGKESKPSKEKVTPEWLVNVLDWTYDRVLCGVPEAKISSCYDLASEYLQKAGNDPEKAAKKLVSAQLVKCGTTGFLTGLGGLVTIPVTLPADLTIVWLIQLRMIAAIAIMGGCDPKEDLVKTISYACLGGQSTMDVVKQAGVEITKKGANVLITKIPFATIKTINQKVGFRLITKFGEKGIINLGKMVPIAGGVVSGSFDIVTTRIAANTAINTFVKDQIL